MILSLLYLSPSLPSHTLYLITNKCNLSIISFPIIPFYDHHLLSFQLTLLVPPQLFNTSRTNNWLIPLSFHLCPHFPPYLAWNPWSITIIVIKKYTVNCCHSFDSLTPFLKTYLWIHPGGTYSVLAWLNKMGEKIAFHIVLLISVATLSFQLVRSKYLESSLTPVFLPHTTSNPSANPVDSLQDISTI